MSDASVESLQSKARSILNVERDMGIQHGDVVYRLIEVLPFEWVIRKCLYRGVESPGDLNRYFTQFDDAKTALLKEYERFLDEALKLGSILENLNESSAIEYGSGVRIVGNEETARITDSYRIKRINEAKKNLK